MSGTGWQPGRSAAKTFGPNGGDPEPEFHAYIAGKAAEYEPVGLPIEVLAQDDPRADPAFEPAPPDHPLAARELHHEDQRNSIHTVPARKGDPLLTVQRRGPSYVVAEARTDLVLTFREVRTDRELSADVSVALDQRHLFRTTSTLSLTARDKLAKTAAEFGDIDPVSARRAVFAAIEAVLEAEEQVGAPIDLRAASLALPAGGLFVINRFWPVGSMVLIAPGDAGKSTIARACALSIASGIEVLPALKPRAAPLPVLYIAGEDPVVYWHSRSLEAICRGVGIERDSVAEPIQLIDARGRPLHRLARSLAERAADFGAIILDSQQALLPQIDANGGIRDRDSLFWNAVDQLEVPTLIVAHPNRTDARDWQRADDGRVAGSEVNRDRARMVWRATWKDEKAVAGTSYRRYTLANTKNNHGPKESPISFGAGWTFGYDEDPGEVNFLSAEPLAPEDTLSPELTETLAAYRNGHTTPKPLAEALKIGPNTAKSRLRLLKERGLLDGSHES